jgi:hypothetical protein
MPVFLYFVASMNESKNSFKALAKQDLDSVFSVSECVILCFEIVISALISDDGTGYVVYLFFAPVTANDIKRLHTEIQVNASHQLTDVRA